MEELIDKILVNIQRAYATWGWWSLLIIVATFAIMIGVNALMKLIFKKATSTQMQGMRKALSSCSVFAVAIGVIYLFGVVDYRYGLCEGINYTVGLVVSNSVPVAFCAMSLWAIVKAVGRVGVLPLFHAVWNKIRKPFKKLLGEIPLEKTVREAIFNKIDAQFSQNAISANLSVSDYIANNSVAANRQVASMLTGLVDTATVAKCTEMFIEAIKAKYPKKEENKVEK